MTGNNHAWQHHCLPALPFTSTISRKEAVALLQQQGVKGSPDFISQVIATFHDCDLNIHLIAGYLKRWFRGDARKLEKIPLLWPDKQQQGRQTRRLLAAYAEKLEDSREIAALYLLSLFDKPVSVEEIRLVLNQVSASWLHRLLHCDDEFTALFAPLAGCSQRKLGKLYKHLESLSLLLGASAGIPSGSPLVSHPEVQLFFRKQFHLRHPRAWKKMNRYLARHFSSQVKTGRPQSRAELLLLMQAVKHTCEAGDINLALKTYYHRVRSHKEADTIDTLQAFDIDLYILINFFKEDWQTFRHGVPQHMRTYLLKWAYQDLLELGRKRESLVVLNKLKQHLVTYKSWARACVAAWQCCRLHLRLKEISQAVEAGKEYLVYADLSGNPAEHIRSLLEIVKILHDNHYDEEAFVLFQQAEQVFNKPKFSGNHQLIAEMQKLRSIVKVICTESSALGK